MAFVYHSNFWLYLNKFALWTHMFENLLVTAGLGFLVYIHTETPVINHCSVALFCYLEQGIVLPENSSCTGENLLLKFL